MYLYILLSVDGNAVINAAATWNFTPVITDIRIVSVEWMINPKSGI